MALRDIHTFIEEEEYKRLKALCTHRGDLTWHISLAVKAYIRSQEEKLEKENRKLMEVEV
jgi:hypothetical protein